MFNNRKLEIRLKKDTTDNGVYEETPSITKEEVLAISKSIVKYVVGGALLILAGAAVLDTAKYGAMTAIENKSQKEDD
jgi:hypothetical protein